MQATPGGQPAGAQDQVAQVEQAAARVDDGHGPVLFRQFAPVGGNHQLAHGDLLPAGRTAGLQGKGELRLLEGKVAGLHRQMVDLAAQFLQHEAPAAAGPLAGKGERAAQRSGRGLIDPPEQPGHTFEVQGTVGGEHGLQAVRPFVDVLQGQVHLSRPEDGPRLQTGETAVTEKGGGGGDLALQKKIVLRHHGPAGLEHRQPTHVHATLQPEGAVLFPTGGPLELHPAPAAVRQHEQPGQLPRHLLQVGGGREGEILEPAVARTLKERGVQTDVPGPGLALLMGDLGGQGQRRVPAVVLVLVHRPEAVGPPLGPGLQIVRPAGNLHREIKHALADHRVPVQGEQVRQLGRDHRQLHGTGGGQADAAAVQLSLPLELDRFRVDPQVLETPALLAAATAVETGRQPVQCRPVRTQPAALELQCAQERVPLQFHLGKTGGGHVQGGVERTAAGGPGAAGSSQIEERGKVQILDREVGAGDERVEKRLADGRQVDKALGLQAAVPGTGEERQGVGDGAPGQAARETDLAGQFTRAGGALIQGDEAVRTVHPHGQSLPPGQGRGGGRLLGRGGRGHHSIDRGRRRPLGEQGDDGTGNGQFAKIAGGKQQGEQSLVAANLGRLGAQPLLRDVPAQTAAAERPLPAHRALLDLQGSGQSAVQAVEEQRGHRP